MKIGFDAKRAFNNHTGLGNYSRLVISGMLSEYPQHEYYLFTPSVKKEFSDLFGGYNNVRIITPVSFFGKTFKAFWRTFGIAGLCKALELDAFHGLSNELPAGIHQFDGRKIVTIHDLIFLRYPHYYKTIDRKIYKRKFRTACLDADVIVAASKQTALDIETFLQVDKAHIKVVYQGCDPQFGKVVSETTKDEVRAKYDLPGHFILCIGTIEERKDQLTVLKAWHRAELSCKLVFVGRQTPYSKQLHDYITQHNLQKDVHFIEGAAFEDFPAFYQLAAAAVYASEFEGFGIPVLEGLRSGTKMLVADSSSLPEVGGDAVEYFEPGNDLQLSSLLKASINTPFNPYKAEKQLAKFDTHRLMQQLFSLYTP
jgi:glycosyltransferase involved in cell wall biosynthesis